MTDGIFRQGAWRLVVSRPSDGPLNMAVDEALLSCFDTGRSLPVLRLYGWSPPALSLGRFQDAAAALDLDRCRQDGISIVRRVSGGGTIYHADELTYSIVCTQSQIPPAVSVKESFRALTGFLLEFYRSLGLDASYAFDSAPHHPNLGERTAFCFAGRESFDILIGGRKIGGNAQRRQRRVIFQHGSIPLVNRAATGLEYMRDRRPEYAAGCSSLADLGVGGDRSRLVDRLVQAFRSQMGVKVHPDVLTPAERDRSLELQRDKYSQDDWNLKGVAT